MNCNDFIKTTEMQIYVLYRGMSKSDNKTCYIAHLWYIYSLICSVRKTEMTNTSFDKYYSHTMTDSLLQDLYLKLLWETLSQKMKAEKNRWKKTLHDPVKRMKKDAIFALKKKIKNTTLTQQRLCTYPATTAPLGGEKKKTVCAQLLRVATCHYQVMPSMLQLISHSFSPKLSSEAILEQLAGAQSLSTHNTEGGGQTMAITCCVAFEQTFGTTKITVRRKIRAAGRQFWRPR